MPSCGKASLAWALNIDTLPCRSSTMTGSAMPEMMAWMPVRVASCDWAISAATRWSSRGRSRAAPMAAARPAAAGRRRGPSRNASTHRMSSVAARAPAAGCSHNSPIRVVRMSRLVVATISSVILPETIDFARSVASGPSFWNLARISRSANRNIRPAMNTFSFKPFGIDMNDDHLVTVRLLRRTQDRSGRRRQRASGLALSFRRDETFTARWPGGCEARSRRLPIRASPYSRSRACAGAASRNGRPPAPHCGRGRRRHGP